MLNSNSPLKLEIRKLIIILEKILEYFKQIRERTERFDRENWGSSLITGFMLLLIASAFLLTAGLTPVAESTAILAYFALLIGVVLQLIFFRKKHEERGSRV
jgi:hypothetical protein